MGSSRLWGKIIVLVAVCGWVLSAQAKYAGGSGTQAEPFRITAVSDWQELMATPADWASHFVLTADIDLNDVPITPIGNNSINQFTGVFDGNDCVIRNADVNMPGSDYVGLFGYLGTNGQIRNLGVQDVSIFGYDSVGGLVGGNGGNISNCYLTGSVSGTGDYVGGLAGSNGGAISNCYSTGSVAANYFVGGLVGYNGVTISNCYSTGTVSGTGSYVGGLVGGNDTRSGGTISRSFWDVNTSHRPTSAGGTGKSTAQMQDINTFLEAGWDFVAETANGTCSFWLMLESGGYPVLSTLNGYIPPEPSGSGTEAHPYIIRDANELGTVWYRPSACYVMANDIDLVGIRWSTAVVPVFNGVFDGNGYAIRNAGVNMPDGHYVGLVAYLRKNAQITNLGVEDTSILGRHYVGGVVGFNGGGRISNCYSTGSITGRDRVGGLVGRNDQSSSVSNSRSAASVNATGRYAVGGLVGENRGSITKCYSAGSISGIHYVGGLVGYNNSATISNCYSNSPVSGEGAAGGLVGYNSGGTINDCYSSGSVSSSDSVGGLVGIHLAGEVADSFWDVDTSEQSSSAGGTPKTTEEMKTESTFTSAGWDFIDVWDIGENQTYAFLRTYAASDINHDGVVDFRDIAHLAESWLRDVR